MSTRPCARCGTRIPTDQYLCADCREERPVVSQVSDPEQESKPVQTRTMWRGRPLARGMVLPSKTQYHGTMFAFIAAAVAVTMAAAVLINKGAGPFTVSGTRSSDTAGVIKVSGLVLNSGTRAGRARCVAAWTTTDGGRQQTGVVQTPVILAQATYTVTIPLTETTVLPSDLSIDCA
jgi:hypothetical protein